MRILEIAPPWFTVPPVGYGGIEQVVAALADGLVDAGHDVTLLASGGSTSKATVQSVFDEPPSLELGSTCHELIHVVAGYHRRDEFDIIHDHSGFTGAALGTLLDGPPVVHTLHGPWVPEVENFHLQLGDALHRVAISHDQRSRAPEGVRVDHVVHNGIDLVAHPFRATADPDRHLAFVGRANREKGPEVAVRAARATGRHLKMAVKINEPPEERYWDSVVAPLLVGADVEVIRNGTKQDAIDVMSGAEATLFPIAWPEPFGLVMAESMAVGTPVIAYASGAATEVIDHGRTGVLVSPGDFDGLVAAVSVAGLIDRQACRDHVERSFSSQAMIDGYVEVFEHLAGQRRGDGMPALAGRRNGYHPHQEALQVDDLVIIDTLTGSFQQGRDARERPDAHHANGRNEHGRNGHGRRPNGGRPQVDRPASAPPRHGDPT